MKYTTLTGALLGVLILLGVADTVLLEGLPANAETTEVAERPTSSQNQSESSSSRSGTNQPATGVRPNTGPDVLETLVSNDLKFNSTNEQFILDRVIADDTVNTRVLLHDNDRAGAVAWVESPQVKQHYLVLKESLHTAFTSDVRDLLDETQRREGKPTRNLLTFIDTGLLPERVVFVRVRERLYEFHVADGGSELIFEVIEDLTE